MVTEIELKAWVKEPQELKSKLSHLAVFRKTFEKNDIFFTPPDSEGMTGSLSYGVRLRRELTKDLKGAVQETNYVTYKSKDIQNGIEVNDEREFEVSSAPAFEEFLLHLGYRERIRKRKKGSSYDKNGMTVELTEVGGLGWFIELEILLPEREDSGIEKVRERLLNFLDKLEISRNYIESRSYTSMLSEINLSDI